MARGRKYPVNFSYSSQGFPTKMLTFLSIFSEDTDKVYFRKKDEISDYAEFMFKAKILLVKK